MIDSEFGTSLENDRIVAKKLNQVTASKLTHTRRWKARATQPTQDLVQLVKQKTATCALRVLSESSQCSSTGRRDQPGNKMKMVKRGDASGDSEDSGAKE